MNNRVWEKIPQSFSRKNDFIKAISEFLLKESFLFSENLNERTLTHKLAEYIQKYFQDYHVDCEYNSMMLGEEYITKRLNLNIENVNTDDITQKTVFPDIIIHKRGDNVDNLVVIEVKKKENNHSKEFDLKKLEAFKRELNYTWAFYIEFDNLGIVEIKVVETGDVY